MKTTITLAIVALLAATAARAEVITKGGAAGLMKAPDVRTGPQAAPMNCAACTSKFVTVKVPTFKGTEPRTAIIERHECKTCETKVVTTGHGKAKVERAVHTCGGCKA